jgi:hypothetical protein
MMQALSGCRGRLVLDVFQVRACTDFKWAWRPTPSSLASREFASILQGWERHANATAICKYMYSTNYMHTSKYELFILRSRVHL